MITPSQCRGARAMLALGLDELASAAGIDAPTIAAFEQEGAGIPGSSIARLRAALEGAGIIFIDSDGDGPGVRLRRHSPATEGVRPEDLNAANDD